jgi:class 3 adenylate cyclase/CheY-like chemotaxis protein
MDMQHKINEKGAMRAFCILSGTALKGIIERNTKEDTYSRPSLIIADYDTELQEQFASVNCLQNVEKYGGVPLVFAISERTEKTDEKCYDMGASFILTKPMSDKSVTRIERMAWQYEKTRNYEKLLQKQAYEIKTSREIKELNVQLESRNELLRKIFGKYFSDEVVEVILENPNGANIGGDKREVTVMMADLRGFTSMSEKEPAEVITQVINNFLEKMTEVIFEFNGSIIEFIGDAILAVFGAPIELECPNESAIAAAINMQNAMENVNEYNRIKGYPRIEMGIGLNRGEVFIGNIGSEKMMRYNIIGNVVNVCSRIESCSVGGQILVSEDMTQGIKDNLDIINTKEIFVKGISHKLSVCEIAGIKGRYNCQLRKMPNEEFIPLQSELSISLYPIKEKQIEDNPYNAVIKAMSNKCVLVEIPQDKQVELYSDVEIVADRELEKDYIKSNSGKIMWKKENQIMIRF